MLEEAPHMLACAFSRSKSLIDFWPDVAVVVLLTGAPNDIDHKSSKLAEAAGFCAPGAGAGAPSPVRGPAPTGDITVGDMNEPCGTVEGTDRCGCILIWGANAGLAGMTGAAAGVGARKSNMSALPPPPAVGEMGAAVKSPKSSARVEE